MKARINRKNMDTVLCDNCFMNFKIKQIEEKDGEYTIRYFACPHCGKKYITYVEDINVRIARSNLNNSPDKLKELKKLKAIGIKAREKYIAEKLREVK